MDLAGHAVWIEPVSTTNSPLTGKNTGKFTKAGSLSGPERSNYPMFWGLSSESPIKSNRELLERKQGNHFRTQGILLEIAPALLLQSSPQIGRWHRLAVTAPRAVITRRATRPSDRGRLGRPNRRSQSKFGIKHPEACQASYRTSPRLFIRPAEKKRQRADATHIQGLVCPSSGARANRCVVI